MNKNSETSVIHIASINIALVLVSVHPNKEAQIASLLTKKVKIPDNYSDFVDIFSKKKALILPKCIELNEHTIDLENGKQALYGPIYSLGLVEL